MRKLKMVLSLALCITLLFVSTPFESVPAKAASQKISTYVGLGDSVITGYGLANFNQNDKKNTLSENNFLNKISKKMGKKSVNLGVEGIDSTRLLNAIQNPATAEQKSAVAQIKTADTIIISVGGNNVFVPILNAVNDKIGSNKNIYTANQSDIQMAALQLLFDQTAFKKMQDNVTANISKFIGNPKENKLGDFDSIISQVKKLNPKSQIVVLTIYNPYKSYLPDSFNNIIASMNSKIIKSSENGKKYKVADVYSAFDKAAADKILVNCDTGKSFDPHPTLLGHDVIYRLVYFETNNVLPYNVKTSITKGNLKLKVSAGMLNFVVTPDKGYKAPDSISLTIGKSAKMSLKLTNSIASVPIADVNTDITVTGACRK